MSCLDTVLGNSHTINALQAALQKNTLHHAIILAAPDGCGRNHASRCLAADYLYKGDSLRAQAVLRGEDAEVLLVEGEGKSGQISVGRIRQVRADVFQSALSAEGRVVLIRNAHRMAAPAANALLKVLEEPPKGVLFILTTRSVQALWPTIASRCVQYSLAPLPQHECAEHLAALQPESELSAKLLACIYGGRLGLCLQAAQTPERTAILKDALLASKAAAVRNSYELLRVFSKYEGTGESARPARDALLADMTAILHACMLQQSAEGLPVMPPTAAGLLLSKLSPARSALQASAAPKITFTALAVALQLNTVP